MPKLIDMTGQSHGRLTVIGLDNNARTQKKKWLCRCECGNLTSVPRCNLINGHTSSCGCLRQEKSIDRRTSHGMSKTRPYGIWINMLSRCGNPKVQSFPMYGGRGITVCARWKKFENFWEDMRHGYNSTLSIDRIDSNGNYEPGNCRWANAKAQARNTRRNRTIDTPEGPMLLCEAIERSPVTEGTMRKRLARGVPTEKLFDKIAHSP